MTKRSTTTQETRELEPDYIGADEVWPLPWHLSPDQLELRDANGHTVIKAWNGHANILYAHKAVNSHAALTDEVTRLREALEPFTNNGRCFIFHRNVEEGNYFECLFCKAEAKKWNEIEHTHKCLIGVARAALQPKTEQEQGK